MATSGSFANTFAPGFRDIVGTSLARYSAQYSKHYNVETSERKYEDYLHATGIPLAQPRAEGQPVLFVDPIEGGTKRFTHNEFAIGVQFTKEAWDDDLYKAKSAMRAAAKGISDSMTERVEVDAADAYVNGFTTYGTIDGASALFASTHARLDGGGNQSNTATGAAVSATAIMAAKIQMEKWLNDRGIRIPLDGNLDLVYGIDQQYTVETNLGTPQVLDSANNNINPVYRMGINPIKWPYLPLTNTKWYLRMKKHFMLWLWRERPTMDAYDDKNTRTSKFACFMRYSFGPVHWLGIYGNAGA